MPICVIRWKELLLPLIIAMLTTGTTLGLLSVLLRSPLTSINPEVTESLLR